MTAPLGSDLTVYWSGTAITGTSGSVTRALKRMPEFSPYVLSPSGVLVGATDVIAEQGDPTADAMRCVLHISHQVAGGASETAVERALMDEVRTYQAILNPMAGAGTLRIDRSTAAGASVSSEVPYVRIVSTPRYGLEIVPGDGLVEPTRGYLETAWELWCPLPYFYDRTATTAEVTADSPAGTQSVANPGIAPCGVRFRVKNGGVTGSPTELTITNTTSGASFVWRKLSGSFAASDYIDWFYTDPREEAHISGTSPGSSASPTGADYMELPTGTSTVSALRSAGTGTVTLTMSWKPRYLSL